MARLVDDLLDVSRITREIELPASGSNCRGRGAVETAAADRRRGTIACDLAARPPRWLDADPTRLAQVLANLLNNAAKYTEPRRHDRGPAERGRRGVIAVRDTGIGIAPEHAATRLRHVLPGDTAAEAHSGLGIGLTLVKRLVEMHGGRIEAAQRQAWAAASEFLVRCPCHRRGAAGEERGAAAPSVRPARPDRRRQPRRRGQPR